MKRFVTALVLVAALALLSACTTPTTPQASPSPSVAPIATPTVEPVPSLVPSPAVTEGQAKAEPVAGNATIVFDGKNVDGKPYYDAQRELILPLKPLAEAMGWTVQEASSGSQDTLTLTRAGTDEIIVTFTKPTLGQDMATLVTAKKGTESITIADSLVYAENNLYVPESFLDDALEDVEVKLEGEQVVITPAS